MASTTTGPMQGHESAKLFTQRSRCPRAADEVGEQTQNSTRGHEQGYVRQWPKQQKRHDRELLRRAEVAAELEPDLQYQREAGNETDGEQRIDMSLVGDEYGNRDRGR